MHGEEKINKVCVREGEIVGVCVCVCVVERE